MSGTQIAPMINGIQLCSPGHVCSAEVVFGDDATSLRRRGLDSAAEEVLPFTFQANPVIRWEIPHACIHGPYGIVTVGAYAVEETLNHIPFHKDGYETDGKMLIIPENTKTAHVTNGIHVAGGNFDNYYHWMIEILPRMQIEPLFEFAFDGTAVLPPCATFFQDGMMRIFDKMGHRYRTLRIAETIFVKDLKFIADLSSYGLAPHPQLSIFFKRLSQAANIVIERNDRRIYISRGDSQNRVLVNEAQIINAVESFGFEVHTLGNLNVKQQMRLFCSASHIISPHGAGMANLMFCRPGTWFCELHMDTYLNWCFRRLCAIQDINYGCLIGAADEVSRQCGWPHAMRWSLPVEPLVDMLTKLSERGHSRQ